MKSEMVELDGSYLEGGGQILRTALSLSLITHKPVRVFNIRQGRPKPGLKSQHLAVLKALGEIFSSRIEGAYLDSSEIKFFPGEAQGRFSFKIDIGTAGSIGLLLQAILPAVIFSENLELSLEIKGGTAGKWAIPCDYYPYVVFPLLGIEADFKILKRGYYPKGGGLLKIKIKSQSLASLNFLERGSPLKIEIVSVASESLKPKKVCERQIESALEVLKERYKAVPISYSSQYVETFSLGSEVNICFYFQNSRLWADALGEKGKPAEEVGREASYKLVEEADTGACVDRHLADNLIPYLAFLKGGFKTSEITKHTLTNIWVVEEFLGKIFKVEENKVFTI